MLEKILNDQKIKKIINKVNDIIIVDNCGDHGLYHVTKVMEFVNIILKGLNVDEHTLELGLIAAYLHDIGAIEGKSGHAHRSAEYVEKYLNELNMDKQDIKIIVNAIDNHSSGENMISVIGPALTLSDKIHMSNKRMLRYIDGNNFHNNIKHIIDNEIRVENKKIIVNIITDGYFNYESLTNYKKMIIKPKEMAELLGCKIVFEIDSKVIDLYKYIKDNEKETLYR